MSAKGTIPTHLGIDLTVQGVHEDEGEALARKSASTRLTTAFLIFMRYEIHNSDCETLSALWKSELKLEAANRDVPSH